MSCTQLFLFLYPNCQTIIDVICMFWQENPCFGAKTKTILGSINKNGFLNHPTHQPETNSTKLGTQSLGYLALMRSPSSRPGAAVKALGHVSNSEVLVLYNTHPPLTQMQIFNLVYILNS